MLITERQTESVPDRHHHPRQKYTVKVKGRFEDSGYCRCKTTKLHSSKYEVCFTFSLVGWWDEPSREIASGKSLDNTFSSWVSCVSANLVNIRSRTASSPGPSLVVVVELASAIFFFFCPPSHPLSLSFYSIPHLPARPPPSSNQQQFPQFPPFPKTHKQTAHTEVCHKFLLVVRYTPDNNNNPIAVLLLLNLLSSFFSLKKS